MSELQSATESITLHVQHIGGITDTTVELSPGVTILAGRNATNRTSLLQALMAAFGSDHVSLHGEADRGTVELTVGDTTYTRTIRRDNGTIVTDGDPYLDDTTLADLFAFLLESNEARRAVARGDDLRDLIMRPVDTDTITSQISQLQSEREQIDQKINEISQLKSKIPDLEDKKSDLMEEIEDKRAELAEKRDKIADIDDNIASKQDKQDELDAKLDELSDTRSELERVRRQLDTQRASIDALEDEHQEVASDLTDYETIPTDRINEIDDELRRVRSQRNELDTTIDQLQIVIQFNQDVLDGGSDVFADLHDGGNDETAVTDQLVADADHDDLVCWTCGSDITADQIETMLDRLRDLHQEKVDERSTLDDEISDLQTEQSQLEEQQRQHEQLQTRLADIEDELEERRDRVSDLETRRDDLRSDVEALETEVEELRSDDDHSHLIDLHKQANELEVEIQRLEDDLEDVTAEIDHIEDQIAKRDQLEAQREELTAEIKELRTRIDRLEREAIDQFNDHMETVLEVLDYENLARVWLERVETQQRQGRKKATTTEFDLHVVRETGDGAAYEDTIEHLSESEREVVGLVFALAGYLTHDLHDECPVLLVDSVEAIDPQRIQTLIEYFAEYPDYLVFALLEDDAQTLDEDYHRVTDI